MTVENRLTRLIDEAIDRERERIEKQIHEAADRILAERLAALNATPADTTAGGEWLDREQIQEQYDVPYWKVRDAQISGNLYSVRRGRKVLSKREDVDAVFDRVA